MIPIPFTILSFPLDILLKIQHNKGSNIDNRLECRNVDRNTVQLMIDEMQKTIDTQEEQLLQKYSVIAQLEEALQKLQVSQSHN